MEDIRKGSENSASSILADSPVEEVCGLMRASFLWSRLCRSRRVKFGHLKKAVESRVQNETVIVLFDIEANRVLVGVINNPRFVSWIAAVKKYLGEKAPVRVRFERLRASDHKEIGALVTTSEHDLKNEHGWMSKRFPPSSLTREALAPSGGTWLCQSTASAKEDEDSDDVGINDRGGELDE